MMKQWLASSFRKAHKQAMAAVLAAGMLSGCAVGTDLGSKQGNVNVGGTSGAGFTTFDAQQGGCLDSKNGIDCNNYRSKEDVYMSGGPTAGGIEDGTYTFTVLVPGYQNDGFIDGNTGNLSDTVKGFTLGDGASCGDNLAQRTFTVKDGKISYNGAHKVGTTPGGQPIVQLMPYCDTDNEGGVYILAICPVGATAPALCKFDAFRIRPFKPETPELPKEKPVLTGSKYYDANANGVRDPGEVGIASWPIVLSGDTNQTLRTQADGSFSVQIEAGSVKVAEQLASSPWMQTGNVTSQAGTTGDASATLNADKTYSVTANYDSKVRGLHFGNLCLGAGGGHTPGFWSNKNGAKRFDDADRTALIDLPLVNKDGSDFDPADHAELSNWLRSSDATNMAYKLSSHVAAMTLNVREGFVNGDALIHAPGTKAGAARKTGFATVNQVLAEAAASLAAHGNTPSGHAERAHQEALKNALDNANNNTNFVQPSPAQCPTPVFP